ncbi:MAG: DUF3048 domain-containing protein [Lachnospiraceae bacterium]|nr:DUF3048 domain-containing protein [Lachnospiraceae bacterium]
MKYRKLLCLAATVGLVVTAVTGCGSKATETSEKATVVAETISPIEEAVSEEQEVETEVAEESPYLYPVIGEREVVDGKIQSYLTGEWTDESKANRRPIAVSIPNQKSCLPQYGIGNASVIYQVPLRDNLTRLFCLFEDFDDLDRIGPTRSIRDYMVYIGLEHDAIICHWGSAVYANELLNSDMVDNISQATAGIDNPTPGAFDRYNRSGSYNSTDSAYMFVDGMMSGVDKQGYSWDYSDTFEPKFLFAADGTEATYDDAESATKIWPGKEGNYNTVGAYFEYDEATGKYAYYEYDKPLIDERTGEQIMVDNVVFQVCYSEERDDHGYLIMEMHGPQTGDGTMYFFTNGKVVKGSWQRMNGDEKPAKYYDENGNEIVFNQGKTFVCEIWDKWASSITYE